ncbi:zinc finger HIT domain-containing protein 2 [Lates japonicus]|uniref:Zinc finger HIT domain-containing protein 2 n=1 Tax=Lates japonicus TaxID=270547 RepID=A0AAD3MRG5_LATJO|nr:zinc finger HIT domain-containing protein 2 [Lates japonicus]
MAHADPQTPSSSLFPTGLDRLHGSPSPNGDPSVCEESSTDIGPKEEWTGEPDTVTRVILPCPEELFGSRGSFTPSQSNNKKALNSNRVFSSVKRLLDKGETLILGGRVPDKEDPLAPARAVEAVAHIKDW